MDDLGMWRRYEIAHLPPATLDALMDVVWMLCERLKRRPTGAEIAAAMREG